MALSDSDVQKQIQHMMAFIEQVENEYFSFILILVKVEVLYVNFYAITVGFDF